MVVEVFDWFWEPIDDYNEFLNENPLVREFDETPF